MISNNNRVLARIVIGALLQSTLSDRELEKLCHNQVLQEEIFDSLRGVLRTLEKNTAMDQKDYFESEWSIPETILALVQKKKLSKNAVQELIVSVSHRPLVNLPKNATIRTTLLTFLNSATPTETSEILHILEGSGDAYLDGILKNNRRK